MELASNMYETAVNDAGTAFILEAAGVEQIDPAPEVALNDFDSKV
ncbi:MAG TPA: hypothetical protein VJ843_03175 [Candidatus Saccharimonadales bacterium]|nr:hypothetical protein [Candidatus Saccharimonadales bacterium]